MQGRVRSLLVARGRPCAQESARSVVDLAGRDQLVARCQADDRDERDEDPSTLHAVGLCGSGAAGTVRPHPLGEGLWKGDRLAVLPVYRRCNVGGPLVRFAVATAGDLGGRRMIATVQAQNVRFFVRLGWTPIGDLVPYLGHPHQGMEIPLR
ncbi:MAG: MSMEG_0567/Sll0786 family nitrogen starvation N-acetyltransferase [Egibacteraceae bacterium]